MFIQNFVIFFKARICIVETNPWPTRGKKRGGGGQTDEQSHKEGKLLIGKNKI
jgi:hypothetical protein